ncbi:MAG: glycosyltransferase [Pseudomonadota bacterium]
MHLVITLCTRQRPDLFFNCLRSILAAPRPDGLEVSVVVVENEATPSLQEQVERFAAEAAIPIHYASEPELGIPFARNRCVEMALELGADWIAFIDDDEELSEAWFEVADREMRTNSATVITGPYDKVLPAPWPTWLGDSSKKEAERISGEVITTAATNNTLARRHVFTADGLGLRFDESLRFTGGSDVELFWRVTTAGEEVVWIKDLRVFEHWPAKRLTMKWHLNRTYRVSIGQTKMQMDREGFWKAFWDRLAKTVGLILDAAVYVVLGGVVYVADRGRGRRYLFRSLKKLYQSAAIIAAFAGHTVHPYRSVD